MPRRSGGGGGGRAGPRSAPSRPQAPAPRPTPQQARPASTAAMPPQQGQKAGQQQSGGSGLFGQMASTAAGVAVGSSIGHAIGGMFGGGSSAQEPQAQDQGAYNTASQQQQQGMGGCDMDARNFTSCMNEHNGNMQICSWYLEQLKACQQASSQY